MPVEAAPTFEWSYVFLAVLIPVAILVYMLGNFRAKRLGSARNLEPQGRRMPKGAIRSDPQFSGFVGRALERGLLTPIAAADAQPIMIRGVITTADGNLGGAPGRECVWRNRSGAPRDAAVAAEIVVVSDATGRLTLENLDRAEVIAPEEKTGPRVAGSGLYIGDEIEVIGRFKPERFGSDPDPTRLVYGSMGGDGNLYVRVHSRSNLPAAAETPVPAAAEALSSPASPAQAPQETTE
ncbi:hypothetical protein [Nannocystis bainbridge]|uniref:Uncharacterized protein n=1 Tax=Nannocystis bainbridge TaxID=2995303 RepID=A0ABT5DYP0_9BACT|nr:hypothetical protein [Nannocystis bainbridge]MDC0718733.1 hypothetical protein [Nannocystis bainbridge]MDC0718747.1 hypothetical protein [Nannocystis bainbridge]MDC0722611.1 hypothetical protein [Nannocystis bainbridge]